MEIIDQNKRDYWTFSIFKNGYFVNTLCLCILNFLYIIKMLKSNMSTKYTQIFEFCNKSINHFLSLKYFFWNIQCSVWKFTFCIIKMYYSIFIIVSIDHMKKVSCSQKNAKFIDYFANTLLIILNSIYLNWNNNVIYKKL